MKYSECIGCGNEIIEGYKITFQYNIESASNEQCYHFDCLSEKSKYYSEICRCVFKLIYRAKKR